MAIRARALYIYKYIYIYIFMGNDLFHSKNNQKFAFTNSIRMQVDMAKRVRIC